MTVVKRDGSYVPFDGSKISDAIQKANKSVDQIHRLTETEIDQICVSIVDSLTDGVHVESIQDCVEKALCDSGHFEVAKSYITYRYKRALVRKSNTTDESILSLLRNENQELAEENSNKNTMIAATQRDYIAGEVSRDLTRRILLPEYISKAHDEGAIHFHDADYFIQPIFNCLLINIGDMLDNGTVMNGKLIESPKSFQVACTVTTQIIACVASNQYGGQSVDMRHLGKYLRRSREKFRKHISYQCANQVDPATLERLVDDRVRDELRSGVQTIQYQINTLMTTNGQSPFVTLFLNLREGDPYLEENAQIVEEVLRQRLEGIKNEKGVFITPAFPKLVYVLDEHNCLKGGKYDYITELAVRCSAKRMYPDYISAKKMKENYEGNVFSPMGCVDGSEVVVYKVNGSIYSGPISKMWDSLSTKFPVKQQKPGDENYLYINTTEGVEIYDSKIGFVQNYRIIRNLSDNWVVVALESGHIITCTADHPFETENRGVVFAGELVDTDIICVEEKFGCDTGNGYSLETIEQKENHFPYKITKVKSVSFIQKTDYSYDVTTESEHFTVSGIYSHNCRSFLAPWKDDQGNYKFEGRFNQGVVSINLPQIGILVNGDMGKFWSLLDERLQLCFDALMCRHNALRKVRSDSSPIHWQYGAVARLPKGAPIEPLLYGGYSSISLGYIGLYELTKIMTGQSHTEEAGEKFALNVIQHLRDACDRWKKETNIGFALYGTPAESLCYRFARIDKERFGSIRDVTDKGYYTNSYHVDVREPIDAFSKFTFESQFQKISTGGCISYVEIPNMRHNLEALRELVKFIYDNIQYAEFNTKSDYCQCCGFDGEITLDENYQWECPSCGNKDRSKMNITRRTCGYLGENYWNVGKTKEIGSRVLHI